MGADLYINSLYQPQRLKWEKVFDEAVAERDRVQPETAEFKKAQATLEDAYSRMYERGYFRDSYNDNNLLRKFGLSWWEDVIPMLNADGELSVSQAERLLKMLKEQHGEFLGNLKPMSAARRKEFLDAYAYLQKFLNEAIELDAPIHASL